MLRGQLDKMLNAAPVKSSERRTMDDHVATTAIVLLQALRDVGPVSEEIIRRRVGFCDGDAGRARGMIRRSFGDGGLLVRVRLRFGLVFWQGGGVCASRRCCATALRWGLRRHVTKDTATPQRCPRC